MFILNEIINNTISNSSSATPTDLDFFKDAFIFFLSYILPIIILVVLIIISSRLKDIKNLLIELASNKANEKKDL